jgi:hypothetical protein
MSYMVAMQSSFPQQKNLPEASHVNAFIGKRGVSSADTTGSDVIVS